MDRRGGRCPSFMMQGMMGKLLHLARYKIIPSGILHAHFYLHFVVAFLLAICYCIFVCNSLLHFFLQFIVAFLLVIRLVTILLVFPILEVHFCTIFYQFFVILEVHFCLPKRSNLCHSLRCISAS